MFHAILNTKKITYCLSEIPVSLDVLYFICLPSRSDIFLVSLQEAWAARANHLVPVPPKERASLCLKMENPQAGSE